MTQVAHIQPNGATGGRPPETGYIHHSQILQRSVFDVQCSVLFPSQLATIQDSRNHNNFEDNRYIYHSDHLGSSAFLTDTDGNPTQHLQYLPFGEPFIEQRSVTDYYTPYTFSAKERDPETGYSYFGARYYDANISVWLSVDPMAGRFPYISPYSYVDNNPIRFTDFQGLFKIPESFRKQFPHFTEYLEKQIVNDIQNGANILWVLTKHGTFGSEESAIESVTMDNGCDLIAVPNPCWTGSGNVEAGGCYEPSDHTITLATDLMKQYENIMNNENSTELDKQAALFAIFVVLMEENIHYGNDVYGTDVSGNQTEENADNFEKEVFAMVFNNGVNGKMTPAERLDRAKQIITILNKDPNGFNRTNLPTVPSSEAE